jgi:hypothetical protein
MSGASAAKNSKKLKSAEKFQDDSNKQSKADENETELKRKTVKEQQDAKEDPSGSHVYRKSLRLSKLNQLKVDLPSSQTTQSKKPTSKRQEKTADESLDFKKLAKNVDNIEKQLSEQSILFKKLNKSIQRLSDKLEDDQVPQEKAELSKESLNESETDQQAPTSTNTNLITSTKRNHAKQQSESSLTQSKVENGKEQENNNQHKEVNEEEEKINLKKNPKVVSSGEAIRFTSDSEDDDDTDYQKKTQVRNGRRKNEKRSYSDQNSARSTSPNKTNLKAILNKTKVDTDFITSLIPSKYLNDKRYDPNEINKLRLLSHSYQNFAVKLLVRLFDEDEIIGRNVYGRNYSGDKSLLKKPLDVERIDFIKETVLRLTKTNNPELAWASCVIAMNRKMVDINNKFVKSSHTNDELEDS